MASALLVNYEFSCKLQMKTIVILISCFALVVPQVAAEEITVAAAADLNFALQDLATRFERHTGDKIHLSFGASGTFYAQIQSGAPFDLFFSADVDYPKKLAAVGLIESASLRTYAVGHLVLWVPNASQLDPQKLKMDLLLQPSVQRIAIANPQHAPYGRAAMAAIEHFGLKDKIASKLVLGENISQAAQFVQSGNAQAGLIALSLAMSPTMKDNGKYWELPAESYPEMQQAVGIVSSSKHKHAAWAFIDYIKSPEAVAVLEQYGFSVPSTK
jgi:molybdate transport system substrate-binding protein